VEATGVPTGAGDWAKAAPPTRPSASKLTAVPNSRPRFFRVKINPLKLKQV
jgi:hypothetical protein